MRQIMLKLNKLDDMQANAQPDTERPMLSGSDDGFENRKDAWQNKKDRASRAPSKPNSKSKSVVVGTPEGNNIDEFLNNYQKQKEEEISQSIKKKRASMRK